uniref:hypothetical protein n=1 Tax=Salmonella sp. s54925 TaxID=3159674 RepID=UPI00397EBCE5
ASLYTAKAAASQNMPPGDPTSPNDQGGYPHMNQNAPTMIQASQAQMMSPSHHSDVMISGMQINGVHNEYPPVSMVGNSVHSQVGTE